MKTKSVVFRNSLQLCSAHGRMPLHVVAFYRFAVCRVHIRC